MEFTDMINLEEDENHARPTSERTIGSWHGVDFSVVAWDSVGADVDLAISGMFAREMPGTVLAGSLAHLDAALDGALVALRTKGVFKGEECETFLLAEPPAPIRAGSVLLIGFGEPTAWTPDVAMRVTSAAMTEALRLKCATAAFAPGLLDSGLSGAMTSDGGRAMIEGVLTALETSGAANTHPSTGSTWLKQWIFDAGAQHIDAATDHFRAAFAAHVERSKSAHPTD